MKKTHLATIFFYLASFSFLASGLMDSYYDHLSAGISHYGIAFIFLLLALNSRKKSVK